MKTSSSCPSGMPAPSRNSTALRRWRMTGLMGLVTIPLLGWHGLYFYSSVEVRFIHFFSDGDSFSSTTSDFVCRGWRSTLFLPDPASWWMSEKLLLGLARKAVLSTAGQL